MTGSQSWEKRAFQITSSSRLQQAGSGACFKPWPSVALWLLWTLGQLPWRTIVPLGDLVPDAWESGRQVADYFNALQQAYHKSIFNDILLLGQNPLFPQKTKNKELAKVASDTRLLFFFWLETVWHRMTAPWLSNVSTSISSVLAHYLNPSCWPAREHRLAHAGEIYKCCMGLVWLVYKPLIELLWKNSTCCDLLPFEQIASVGKVPPPSFLLFPCK